MNSETIYFFPIIYPDELFYSVLARYVYYTPGESLIHKKIILFNTRWVTPLLYFASHLEDFCQNINYLYKPEVILQNNTVYPYFSPFLSSSRQNKAFKSVKFKANTLHSSIGTIRLKEDQTRIRWCPECAREDISQFGEAYLHRSHQLSGIDICLKHRIGLLDYEVGSEFSLSKIYQYFCPDLNREYPLRNAQPYEVKLATIATDLLDYSFNQFNIEDILKMLRFLLIERGLASHKAFYNRKIYNRIKESFPVAFLEKNNLIINDFNKYNRLNSLLKRKVVARPIECIVLIALVSDSFNEFVRSAQEKIKETEIFKDLGTCHNPFCRFYNKAGAKRISVGATYDFAIYRCECGQIYTQFKDSEEHYNIVQLGSLYGREIQKLRENGMSYEKISRICNISRKGVEKQLNRNNFTPVDDRLEIYKNQLLEEIERNPGIEKRKLASKFLPAFNYLYRYDHEFYESLGFAANSQHTFEPGCYIDKEQKDQFYSDQVESVAFELYEKLPEVMVSQRRIIELLKPRISVRSVKSLKTTAALVKHYAESKHDFQKRKLLHQIQDLIESNPDFLLTKDNVQKVLGLNKSKIELYWSEIVTIVTNLI